MSVTPSVERSCSARSLPPWWPPWVAVPLSRRIIRPLRRVTDAARLVGRGDPTARAGHHDAPGELGELAQAFDDMAERLEANEAARRNVVTDLAHELRTPLTVLQGNCEEVIDGITAPTLEGFVAALARRRVAPATTRR